MAEGSWRDGCRHNPSPHLHRDGDCDYAPRPLLERPPAAYRLSDQDPERDDHDDKFYADETGDGSALAELFDDPEELTT